MGEAEVGMTNETVMRAVLRVGDGRGFVVDSGNSIGLPERIVITAAHCLPSLLPYFSAVASYEYTFPNLLGPLDASPTVWAECMFADPRADIAVLAQPDNQALFEQAKAYDRLMRDTAAVPVADVPEGTGYVLTLDGKWKQGRLERFGYMLGFAPERYIAPGMSGSPIVSAAGAAIGLISTSSKGAFDGLAPFHPVLLDCLPAWLTKQLVSG